MKQLTLLERLERLNAPYQKPGRRFLQELAKNSVRSRVEHFLKTIKGMTRLDAQFGMDTPSEISHKMSSPNIAEKQDYLRALGQKIASCDRRIHRVFVEEGNHQRQQGAASIPFLEIEVQLQADLGVDEHREPFRFVMAYDYTGRVFDVKKED